MTERDLLAAELALGLLEGEELLAARGLAASDRAFARAVSDWEERLAPLLAGIGEAEPPVALRQRILDAVVGEGESGTVVSLRRRLGFWKGVSAAATAIAASLALAVAYDWTRAPPAIDRPASVMVASLVSEDQVTIIAAAWRPEESNLAVMPGAIQDPVGQDHELWVIPADGTPRSLGLVDAGRRRIAVPPALAPLLSQPNAVLALSVEPAGGSPTGLPTGPVVASGPLQKV